MANRKFKSVLITGITGSGGSYLADHIVANHPEAQVHGIARWHSTSSHGNLTESGDRLNIHECDLNDFSSVLNVLREVKPDVIFHIAAHANVQASFNTPLTVLQNNIMGTATFYEAIRQIDFDPIILLCSSSEVYGQVDPKYVPITEECPLNPSSPYAVSKLTQDMLGYTYFRSYGMKVIRTRMFAYFNPRRADLFATSFALQIARIEAGLQKVLKHGNLESTRTMMDVRDVMECYWLAATNGEAGETYNIGGNNVITVGEFLEILVKLAECNIVTEQDPKLMRPSDVTLQIPDTTKFKQIANFEPKFGFEESVDFLLSHCRRTVAREVANLAQDVN
jgi:GDP-4-dehydro-6-deoxy-D-mannose reductase